MSLPVWGEGSGMLIKHHVGQHRTSLAQIPTEALCGPSQCMAHTSGSQEIGNASLPTGLSLPSQEFSKWPNGLKPPER